MHILIIDNYDSFTYNLYQQVANLIGKASSVSVVKNDEITTDEISAQAIDCIFISPGPGRPEIEKDFGICTEVIRNFNIPLLGVCLGHQGIGLVEGGTIIHSPEPFHGRLSRVFHNEKDLFEGIPQGFKVVRYHSLMIANPLPVSLRVSAWTSDNLIMGIEHNEKPLWGIQFHPESICTEYGNKLIANFLKVAYEYNLNLNNTKFYDENRTEDYS